MPANLPSPIVGAGGGSRPGVGEQLLMTLASAAPGMLMQYLDRRHAAQDQQAQGDAAVNILTGLAQEGTISPDLFTRAGGSYTPGITVEGAKTPTAPGPLGVGITPPTVSKAAEFNGAGINRRIAPQLLAQALGTQKDVASIEASRTQTAEAKAAGVRAAELHPFELEQIREGINLSRLNQRLAEARDAREEQQTNATIANEAARIQIAREELALRRQQAYQDVEQNLASIHSDLTRNYTNLAQLYASTGMAPDAASAKAASEIWKTTKPVTLDQFLEANKGKVTASLLQNQDADPNSILIKSVLGDRPDVEYGTGIGLSPAGIAHINSQLELENGDGSKVLAGYAKDLKDDSNKDQELAKMVRYLSYKTGSKIELPVARKSNILAALKLLVNSTPVQATLESQAKYPLVNP